jgi:hypothetical protein
VKGYPVGWLEIALWSLALAVPLVFAVVAAGDARWNDATDALHRRLDAARERLAVETYDAREIETLPEPVQRYFRRALTEGQAIVATVNVGHSGHINLGQTDNVWKRFSSSERVVTRRPGFVWNARVGIAPGIAIFVHDAYVAGEGISRATILGLVGLAAPPGGPEIAEGQLLRYLAEAPWYPTALLPSQGVQWQAVDARSACATLTDGASRATLLFRFRDDDLIDSAHSESRARNVGGKLVMTPWEGYFNAYQVCQGMRVPMEGEVAWLAPEGRKTYWRGVVDSIRYEFAKPRLRVVPRSVETPVARAA